MVFISVVLSTYNRADLLPEVLGLLLSQSCDPGDYEIVVVDNNSKDATKQVVKEFARRHPGRVRYLFEAAQGIAFARNRGAREARGRVLAYLDDDCFAHQNWVGEHIKVYRSNPDADAVGGRILLRYEDKRPGWISPIMENSLGLTDFGEEPGEIAYPEYPKGGNFSVLKSHFDGVGGFDEKFGHTGASIVGASEHDLFRRLTDAGTRVVYNPDAIVRHFVPRERATRRYVYRRFFRYGITGFRFDATHRGLSAKEVRAALTSEILGLPRLIYYLIKGEVLGVDLGYDASVRLVFKLGRIVGGLRVLRQGEPR